MRNPKKEFRDLAPIPKSRANKEELANILNSPNFEFTQESDELNIKFLCDKFSKILSRLAAEEKSRIEAEKAASVLNNKLHTEICSRSEIQKSHEHKLEEMYEEQNSLLNQLKLEREHCTLLDEQNRSFQQKINNLQNDVRELIKEKSEDAKKVYLQPYQEEIEEKTIKISELHKQLESCYKQIEYLQHEMKNRDKEVHDLKIKLANSAEAVNKEQKLNIEKQEELAKMGDEYRKALKRRATIEENMMQLERKNEKLEMELKNKNSRMEALRKENIRKEKMSKKVHEEMEHRDVERHWTYEQMSLEIEELKRDKSEKIMEIQKLHMELQEVRNEAQKLKKGHASALNELGSRQEETFKLRQKVSDMTAKICSLEKDVERQEPEDMGGDGDLKNLKCRARMLESENRRMRHELESHHSIVSNLKLKLASKEGALASAQSVVKKKEMEIGDLHKRIDEEQQTRGRCYREAIRCQNKVEGWRKKYERAVEQIETSKEREVSPLEPRRPVQPTSLSPKHYNPNYDKFSRCGSAQYLYSDEMWSRSAKEGNETALKWDEYAAKIPVFSNKRKEVSDSLRVAEPSPGEYLNDGHNDSRRGLREECLDWGRSGDTRWCKDTREEEEDEAGQLNRYHSKPHRSSSEVSSLLIEKKDSLELPTESVIEDEMASVVVGRQRIWSNKSKDKHKNHSDDIEKVLMASS